jgi:PadR family transcriptional regulator, regulatory protein PadR
MTNAKCDWRVNFRGMWGHVRLRRDTSMCEVPGYGYAPAPPPPQLQRSYYFTIIEDMRKRDYLGQLELMVLFAVMRVNMNAYGVLISQEISKQSGRDVSIASVYAALERLEKKGLITSLLGEPTAERGGKARTYFKPTAAGLKEARDAHGTLMRLSSGLPGLKGQIA